MKQRNQKKQLRARSHGSKEPDFKFWAFPRRSREFTVEEPAQADRTREKV